MVPGVGASMGAEDGRLAQLSAQSVAARHVWMNVKYQQGVVSPTHPEGGVSWGSHQSEPYVRKWG